MARVNKVSGIERAVRRWTANGNILCSLRPYRTRRVGWADPGVALRSTPGYFPFVPPGLGSCGTLKSWSDTCVYGDTFSGTWSVRMDSWFPALAIKEIAMTGHFIGCEWRTRSTSFGSAERRFAQGRTVRAGGAGLEARTTAGLETGGTVRMPLRYPRSRKRDLRISGDGHGLSWISTVRAGGAGLEARTTAGLETGGTVRMPLRYPRSRKRDLGHPGVGGERTKDYLGSLLYCDVVVQRVRRVG